MAQFQYRATDAEGKILEGMIEATERNGAVARLQDRGLIPLRVAEPDAKRSGLASISLPSFSFKRGVRGRDLLIFTPGWRCSAPACRSIAACRSSPTCPSAPR
jgi:general secretion pathway protein F